MTDKANRGASGEDGQSSTGRSEQGDTGLPPGLAAAIALVVAGLAAVGVTGDALTKAVRNEPGALGAAVIVALAASVLLAITAVLVPRSETPSLWTREFWKKFGKNWRTRSFLVPLGLVALLSGVAWAIVLGASSVADREQPLVTLASTSERTGNRTLTVQVSASGLRTSEQVLVQVIGLKKFTQADKAVVQVCETNWTYNSGLGEKDVKVLSADTGTVLLWNRIGPDPAGKVNATIKIPIPSNGYQGVCAWAPLPDRPGQPGNMGNAGYHRNSAAYLKVT